MQAKGFTLIEVLITMVLVVVGLVLLTQAVSAGLRAMSVSDRSSQALFLMQQKITEIENTPFSTLQSGTGDFSPDNPDYAWQIDVTTTDLENLRQVQLTVSWTQDNTTRSLSITKLIADHGGEQAS